MTDKNTNQVFLASSLAGIICNSITNPLDVVKVRLQNDAKKCHCADPSLCINRSNPISKSNSISHASVYSLIKCANLESKYRIACGCLPFNTNTKALIYLVRKEGPRVLANGITHGVTASTISVACFFSFYEAVRSKVGKFTQNKIMAPLLSSMVARTLTTSLIFPFEYWKTVRQGSTRIERADKSILKNLKGIKNGYSSLLIRDNVFAGVNWIIIENIREKMKSLMQDEGKGYENKQILLITNILAGGLAGACGSMASIPFDVVKTRKQLNPHEYRRMSCINVLREVYRNEGSSGLFLGARQRVSKVTIGTAGMLTLYELFMDILRGGNLELKPM